MKISDQRMANLKSTLLRAAGGAIALAVVGFTWGGWVTGGTAERHAMRRADAATVLVLAPICVDAFRRQPDAGSQLINFQKLSSYDQRGFVGKGGWATALGRKDPNASVARSCAETLSQMKAADIG